MTNSSASILTTTLPIGRKRNFWGASGVRKTHSPPTTSLSSGLLTASRAINGNCFSLYVNIFSGPFDEGLAGLFPARDELPGKDSFFHTARPIKRERSSFGSLPGPIDDWRDVLRAPVI